MTPERIEQERNAFEEWFYENICGIQLPLNKSEIGRYCNFYAEDMFTAWCAAKSHAEQSEWISVEDRLPEKEGYYLTCAIGCAVKNCQFDGTYFSYQQYDEEEWEFVEVIWFPDYWLSIPLPPTTDPAA